MNILIRRTCSSTLNRVSRMLPPRKTVGGRAGDAERGSVRFAAAGTGTPVLAICKPSGARRELIGAA